MVSCKAFNPVTRIGSWVEVPVLPNAAMDLGWSDVCRSVSSQGDIIFCRDARLTFLLDELLAHPCEQMSNVESFCQKKFEKA